MSKDKKSQPAEEPKPSQPAKDVSRLGDILGRLQTLTPEERDLMSRHGVNVPQGNLEGIITGGHKWGLRCTKCNQVALYFLGTEWEFMGNTYDQPPAIHHSQLAWMQNLHPSQIDRHEPRCQHCGNRLPLMQSGAFDYGRVVGDGRSKLVLVADFEASRDAAFDRKALRQFRRQVSKETASSSVVVDNDYSQKRTPISKTIDEQHGEGYAEQVGKVAEALGINLVPSK